MREHLRMLLAVCFYYSGLVSLANWRIQRSTQRLIILNYHSAAGENLRQQMRYLKRHYRVMHLEDALEELYQPSKDKLRDKRTPVVLTFDDGYLDNYTYGLQLARELHIPFTVFLIPGYIESGACFWWLAGESLLNLTKVGKVAIEEKTYQLPADRQAVAEVIDGRLRCAESVESRETFLTAVTRSLASFSAHTCTRGQREHTATTKLG